jgi:DNA processing protein
MDHASLCLFRLGKLRGVGPATLDRMASATLIPGATIEQIASTDRIALRAMSVPGALLIAEEAAEKDLAAATAAGARIVSAWGNDYPALLKRAGGRPPFLYIQGSLAATSVRSLAIIGTRLPTAHGRVMSQRIAAHFASAGWSVISGLALGCDAAAHDAALEVGGHTVAVLAHGLHTVAPSQHRALAERILESGGALITEFPFGVEPAPHQFVVRDRTQAGLASGVVMVQSDEDGGSMHASRAAIELGRVLAVPVPTQVDLASNSSKIGANNVLLGADLQAKARLLNCSVESAKTVFPLTSKADYDALELRLRSVRPSG